MRKSKGISLISLVITIVVIIILIGISIYNGIGKNISETGNTMDYNEIFEVSNAVNERSLLNRLNSNAYRLIGQTGVFDVDMEIESGDEIIQIQREYTTLEGWYKITPNDMKDLNLEKVRRDYLVNYSTGEVVSMAPITYEDKKYYSSVALNDAISGNEIISGVEVFDDAAGINKPYLVTGMIPVKRVESDWVITNIDDAEWYDYSAAEDGKGNMWANVMLVDDILVEGLTNADVRGMTLKELEGKKVLNEGSMYVWIPRYSVGEIDGKTQIVYSVLTEDYFKNSDVLSAFQKDGVELTGIWVSKYDASYFER